MTKADLVEEISQHTGVSKNHTAIIVDHLLDAVCRGLSEGRHLEIRAFAKEPSFDVVSRDLERAGRLFDGDDVSGLRHLADHLRSA